MWLVVTIEKMLGFDFQFLKKYRRSITLIYVLRFDPGF